LILSDGTFWTRRWTWLSLHLLNFLKRGSHIESIVRHDLYTPEGRVGPANHERHGGSSLSSTSFVSLFHVANLPQRSAAAGGDAVQCIVHLLYDRLSDTTAARQKARWDEPRETERK